MNKINILIEDGFATEKNGGIGRFTKDLVNNLKKDRQFKVYFFYKKKFIRIKPLFVRRMLYIIWLNSIFLIKVKLFNIKIIFFTNYLIPVIKLSSVKFVTSINDISPILHPETKSFLYRIYFKLLIKLAVRKSDYLTTISQTARKDIINNIKKDINISVLYIGIDTEIFLNLKTVEKENLFLYVGSIEKRKNILYGVKILENIIPNTDYKFVICGNKGYKSRSFFDYLSNSKIRKQVEIYYNLTDMELRKLYLRSKYFLHTSIYEGFGLPVVEALYYNMFVIAIDNEINREILSRAGVYISSNDAKKAAKRISFFLQDKTYQKVISQNITKRRNIFIWNNLISDYKNFFKGIL